MRVQPSFLLTLETHPRELLSFDRTTLCSGDDDRRIDQLRNASPRNGVVGGLGVRAGVGEIGRVEGGKGDDVGFVERDEGRAGFEERGDGFEEVALSVDNRHRQ